ncbi:arrestin domain-containing protein 3-like [Archocentrus centrarchus]|uniref:arrestin domain-containing protein 3-like n=1 Tax=Archocentrus centrarchus TaxID=63155 RepID=UPI0011E9C6DE|nr:arrestin domain-containing protein 3-like [Archocentrus centrarchus]
MTIKNFSIEYDAINSKNIFTNGDTINGRIVVEVSGETKVQSLIFRAQGRAKVVWTEHYGENQTHVYWSNEDYYDVKHDILRKSRQVGTEVISKGRHVFPFSFRIPNGRLPSTYKGAHGKIIHKVKAELKQSMRLTKKAKVHFQFVSKADMGIPGLLEPQYAFKDKSVGVFGSGKVSVDVHTKQMGYMQGEAIVVTLEINNNSKRSVKPKFILYEKNSFFAQGHRKLYMHDILKEKAEAIEGSSGRKTVTKVINIPRDLPPSILNSSIIKLEYRLKVQLDIKCAIDPKIKLPIVIMPGVPQMEQLHASAAIGFVNFRNPGKPAWATVPQQAPPQCADLPPAYGAHAMYPSFPLDDYKTTL